MNGIIGKIFGFGQKPEKKPEYRITNLPALVPNVDWSERIVGSAKSELTGEYYSFDTNSLAELFRITIGKTLDRTDPEDRYNKIGVEVEEYERYFISDTGRFLKIAIIPDTADHSYFCREPYDREYRMFFSVIQKADVKKAFTIRYDNEDYEIIDEDRCPSSFLERL